MNGIELLKKIKHEIEVEADYQNENVDAYVAKGMYKAVEIIDKHIEYLEKVKE